MKIRINNPNIANNESSILTSAVAAAGTGLTLKNTNGFTANDYIVVGRMGDETSELRKISSVTNDTAVVIDALDFAHAVNTVVTKIDYNQIELKSATSKTGTYSVVGTAADIQVDQDFTEIEDSSGTSSTWYKIRYYNATTLAYSDYSDPVQGTGYESNSLRKILDKIYTLAHDDNRRTIDEDTMVDFINDAYQKVINRLMKADHKRFIKQGYVSIKNSYNTGTVAVTDGGTTVTGTDTVWSTGWTNKKIYFETEGYPYLISSVGAVGTLTLDTPYDGAGSDLSGASYTIFQDEYDIYDASTDAVATDFKRVEQVFDEDGNQVYEYDNQRTEAGWYIKREGDNLKFCLNYLLSTADVQGRWSVMYLYQPAKLDSMADEPEIPLGYDDMLVDYGVARIKERIDELKEAAYFDLRFEQKMAKLLRGEERRGPDRKGWRLDRNLRASTEHDEDWIDDIYSRATIS